MLANQIREAVRTQLSELSTSGGFSKYTGKYTEALAASLQRLASQEYCLLASSGTAALELILRAAGVGAGDEVLLSAYDYPGNFWAIERTGARPVLVDVVADGWRIDDQQLANAIDQSSRCKALVVSHLHGQLQDMVKLKQICDHREIALIEDACQAIGSSMGGTPLGTHADAVVVSFGGGKLLSAGRGGAVMTSQDQLAQRARLAAGAGSGPYALSELQAAVVTAQLPFLSALDGQCRQFFGQVADTLQSWSANRELKLVIPWYDQLSDTSFYQAGFLLPPIQANPDLGSVLVDRLTGVSVPSGTGFSGFQRRSARRCGRPFPLVNSQQVAERTWVLHHSVAVQGGIDAKELAQLITQELDKADGGIG